MVSIHDIMNMVRIMRLKHVKGASEEIEKCSYVIHDAKEYRGHFHELFGNNNPIHIEIGMGKGDFILNMALKNPDVNFIGIEKFTSVLARAVAKIDTYDISNLKLICIDALNLNDVFDKEVSLIYLNFSDPWPKKRHAKRRLTSDVFLRIYDNVFNDKKIIYMKTDNIGLFEYSIESLSEYGYILRNVSLDYKDGENVMTEYEKKFVSKNIKINRLEAYKR